jgi:hypothetical protein
MVVNKKLCNYIIAVYNESASIDIFELPHFDYFHMSRFGSFITPN